jgi:hypothetical protein
MVGIRLVTLTAAAAVGAVAALAVQWLTAVPHATVVASPYTADSSPVRGLSADEVDDLLNGRGAGSARTAELNGHPGPRHAIDLAAELELTAGQRATAQQIFTRMNDAAKRLGREIVEREGRFSTAFAERRVTAVELQAQAESLGVLYGRLRAVHLAAHLELTGALTADQIQRYDSLRGYHRDAGNGTDAHRHGS